MLNFFKTIWNNLPQNREASEAFNEEKLKMGRQRLMLHEDSIFLADEFLTVAAKVLAKEDKEFQEIYGTDASLMDSWFDLYTLCLPVFMVPFHSISERMQKPIELALDSEAEIVMQNCIDGGRESALFYWYEEPLSGPDEFKDRYIADKKETSEFPAFRMGDLGELLHETGFVKYEDDAIKAGRGALVLDFWKAMNTMDDYSHLFKNTGGGNTKEKKRLREMSVKPAFA